MSATVWLLDVNVLLALMHEHHVHHGEATAWFHQAPRRRWASCAATQAAAIRLSLNPRVVGAQHRAPAVLDALKDWTSHPHHEYWAQAPSPLELPAFAHPAFVGHRQVTDLYLLSLAIAHDGVLATLDQSLAAFAAQVGWGASVDLIATPPTVQEPRPAYAARRRRPGAAARVAR